MNMEMSVDLANLKEFLYNEEFHQFLVSHTTDLATAGWVLQTLLDEFDKAVEALAAAGGMEKEGELDGNDEEQAPAQLTDN